MSEYHQIRTEEGQSQGHGKAKGGSNGGKAKGGSKGGNRRGQLLKNMDGIDLEYLELVEKGGLVKEFWYDKLAPTGQQILYEAPSDKVTDEHNLDRDVPYFKVYTKNAFYADFGGVVYRVSMAIIEVNTNINFCCNLFLNPHYATIPFLQRAAFVAVFVFSKLLWIFMAWSMARKKIQKDPDIVKNTGCIDDLRLVANTTAFFMFNVPIQLPDAPGLFHPSKAAQKFAAYSKNTEVKFQKCRFMVVGWNLYEHFRFEANEGIRSQLPVALFGTLPLIGMQFYAGFVKSGFEWSLVTSLVMSVWSFITHCNEIRIACIDGQRFKLHMQNLAKHPNKKIRDVARRHLAQHDWIEEQVLDAFANASDSDGD